MLTKRQRREARQKFMQQWIQNNMGNGLDNEYFARMAWDKMSPELRRGFIQASSN